MPSWRVVWPCGRLRDHASYACTPRQARYCVAREDNAVNRTLDTIIHRRSVRSYKPDPIPAGALDAILRAGCAAPHGVPREPWRLLVIQQDQIKQRLLDALKRGIDRACGGPPKNGYWCMFFADAPVVIAVAFAPTSMGGHSPRTEDSIGIASAACAIENMLLAAASLGLGACWVGPLWEAKEEFEAVLGLRRPWEFLAFVSVGYTDENPRREQPKGLGDMVQFMDAQPGAPADADKPRC